MFLFVSCWLISKLFFEMPKGGGRGEPEVTLKWKEERWDNIRPCQFFTAQAVLWGKNLGIVV